MKLRIPRERVGRAICSPELRARHVSIGLCCHNLDPPPWAGARGKAPSRLHDSHPSTVASFRVRGFRRRDSSDLVVAPHSIVDSLVSRLCPARRHLALLRLPHSINSECVSPCPSPIPVRSLFAGDPPCPVAALPILKPVTSLCFPPPFPVPSTRDVWSETKQVLERHLLWPRVQTRRRERISLGSSGLSLPRSAPLQNLLSLFLVGCSVT